VTTSDDDRISYLAGEAVDSLDATESAQLDDLRETLKEPATWVEPNPALEDRIVDAIAGEARSRPMKQQPAVLPRRLFRRPAVTFGTIAATVAAAAIVIVVATNNATSARQQFTMAVSGTALAPGAHGSATLTKTGSGWRIELSARGLPHLVGGRYYQAWLKNSAGILVPVGTFNDAVNVTLWSGVPVTQFQTLTVTRQQANGNPASSGQRVLTGTVKTSG
jgi:Anti-sigma-K factor rskA